MDLYKYFEVYEKLGCTAMFVRHIEEELRPYTEALLQYLIAEIHQELLWRVGPKADYLREVLLVAMMILAEKRQQSAE